MSVDTITRVNAYFKTNVADVLNLFTIYKNDNKDLLEPSSGPFVNLWVDSASDDIYTDGKKYIETGQVIAQIRIEEGESTLRLEIIGDAIRNAFRDLKLKPTGGEEGQIDIGSIEPSNAGTIPREKANKGRAGSRPWRGLDLFLNYSKRDC